MRMSSTGLPAALGGSLLVITCGGGLAAVADAEPVCGAPAEAPSWESGDTVGVVLWQANALWLTEREAYRAVQRMTCQDCGSGHDMQFFASSTYVIERLAVAYPSDVRAKCAEAEAIIRNASRGEGEYDQVLLREAERILSGLTELPGYQAVSDRVRMLLEVVAAGLRRPGR